MGIENIMEKILAEANDDARRIFEKGRYDGRGTIYRTERLIKQQQVDLEKKIADDVETVKKRKASVAELEARKMRLGAKQEAISKCFDEALLRLAKLPEDAYIDLLARTIEASGADGGELLLTAADRAKIGEKLVSRVNEGGKAGKVTLSEKTISASGGFVLKKGAVELNSTLEVMVEAVRGEVTPKVVATLFGERG
ncbi:V-type ATP synthase subunit E [Bacilliculturomica massiliensis]|uniref:V-type ATP synthase subunit E n=1 Tax=Bacilliculturomica massiliensis TaxID=1917867 RepID=UPI0010325315|nr:V-type ATP synthase subunit E [Bacilliculturomica massiliensis]